MGAVAQFCVGGDQGGGGRLGEGEVAGVVQGDFVSSRVLGGGCGEFAAGLYEVEVEHEERLDVLLDVFGCEFRVVGEGVCDLVDEEVGGH